MPESHQHLDVAEGKSLSKRDPRQISTSRANIPSHTFRKAFPQGATIRFNNVKYGEILSKKRKARDTFISVRRKIQNSKLERIGRKGGTNMTSKKLRSWTKVSQCQRTPIFIKLRYLMMRWKIHASNNFPICFLWYKKRGFYLKIDNFASLSISIRIKIIRESIEKGVKKRKKILVVSSVEAGFENDRRKAAEAACQRRRGRRRSPRARKFRPERFVSLVTWRSLAKLYLTATDRLRNVSVWIRWREFATEKMDPRLEIFRNEIEEKGLRVYHVENGLTEWFNSVITRTRMK